MTTETRDKLTSRLAEHGLTVLLTREFDATLLQLARLAEFERMILLEAERDKQFGLSVQAVQIKQQRLTNQLEKKP